MTLDLELSIPNQLHTLTTSLPTTASGKVKSPEIRPVPVLTRPSAVFVDRDGVINLNRKDHVLNWKDFQFEDGALEALALLHRDGHKVFVVTNQAIIGRGLATVAQVDCLHARMLEEIERAGGEVQAVLSCPHLPSENCFCRKPRPGLLLQAAELFGVQLINSWFVGDYITDVQAGFAASSNPILVLTGRGQEALTIWQLVRASWEQHGLKLPALPILPNLWEAVQHIIKAERLGKRPFV